MNEFRDIPLRFSDSGSCGKGCSGEAQQSKSREAREKKEIERKTCHGDNRGCSQLRFCP